ncbi:MAG TPA: c-type cytochrome [Ramlibacter sp.]|nr:c-type cytochrome [Ramlibacter sp.]HWI83713.1 c-type cytochrome [Ramlibacter sp.]
MTRPSFLARATALLLVAAASSAGWASPPPADSAGARIATAGTPNGAPACAGCHGARGEGTGAFPHLAGTGAAYLREQLEAFAGGTRKNEIMAPIARALSPEQRTQVADHYAGLSRPAAAPDREARGPADLGAWIATRGRWDDGLPACAQCHGPGGSGVGTSFPPLAGQPAAYLAQQLKAWQAGARPAGPLGLMEAVARKLKDPDIQAVSDYYAGLAAASAAAPMAAGTKGTP